MDDGSIKAFDSSVTDLLLARVKDAGGARFDAAGWHYIDTLSRRAAAHDGNVRRMLEAKLEQAVAVFAERLETARVAASALLHASCDKYPHARAELQQRFADNDFKGLRRLHATLEAQEQCAGLAELVSRLHVPVAGGVEHPAAPRASSPATETAVPALELKTVRESRDTWARLSVDKQLALAMKQAPENAGPINSHMLVLRSLAMMQAVSPDYLSRVVSYVDALIALNPGETAAPVKRKKAAPAKAVKPAKSAKK